MTSGVTVCVAGRLVRVVVPSTAVQRWVEVALGPTVVPDAEVDATVSIEAAPDGRWHVGDVWVRDHAVALAARRAAFAAAAAVDDRLTVIASAVATADAAIVVLGRPEARAAVLTAWARGGGDLLADAVVRFDGMLVEPARAGIVRTAGYQWIDGEPADPAEPGAPLVALDGSLVEVWTPPTWSMAAEPLPVRAVVLPGVDGTELIAATALDVLRALVDARLPGRAAVTRVEAASLVAVGRSAVAVRGPVEDGAVLVAGLRSFLSG